MNTPDLDTAVSRRLGRLRTMPVETRRVEEALRRQIGTPQQRPGRIYRMLHSARALAASAAAVVLVAGVLLYTATQPVSASVQAMARLHEDLVAGRTAVVRVESIAAANEALAAEWPESPKLPGVPEEHAMACCMKSIHNKRVACVLLGSESVPVTMTVAKASDVTPPKSPTVVRGGVTYHTEAAGNLNMISAVREGRYVCLIGAVPADRLIDLAAQLRF